MPTVALPRLLEPVVGEHLSMEVTGETVGEAVESLLALHPGLGAHLFDEEGRLRPHVHCFVDGTGTRLEDRSLGISPDAEIRFLQAVSGG